MTHMRDTVERAFEAHKAAFEASLSEAGIADIERGGALLSEAANTGRKMLVCGNGGSSSDAAHFAGEWTGRYKEDRVPLPAVVLGSNLASLTAIGNDYGYEEVFVREVRALGNEGDVLVAITTSGSSKNVVKAIAAARERKMKVIVLTGKKGAHLRGNVDCVVAVGSEETARIQEFHEFVYHVWCEYVDANLIRP